ncbi:MAG: hypothetical protein ACK4NS_10920 [Saprospiraceae bacterium]
MRTSTVFLLLLLTARVSHAQFRANPHLDRPESATLRSGAADLSDFERLDERKRFNVFVGAYLIPLIARPSRMDFGGHIDFRGDRRALSLGYVYVQERKDPFRGSRWRRRWDGYEAQLALKRFYKSSPAYGGFMLAFAEKEFLPNTVSFVPAQGGEAIVYENHRARERQYKLMFQSGLQSLGRGTGSDMVFGVGLSFNQFRPDVPEYDNPGFVTQDGLLGKRRENFVAFHLRWAWSFGLNIGKPRGMRTELLESKPRNSSDREVQKKSGSKI